jgi:hypothetical protein
MPAGADYREEMPTYSDPVELEAARLRSAMTTNPPPAPAVRPAGELTEADRVAGYARLFGGFDRVPVIVLPAGQLASCTLDSRASMLLGLLDGRSTIQDLLDIGIVNTLDTLAGLAELHERRVIGWKDEVAGP